ncbi:Uncharacterized protein RNJ44_04137 [Nakaseomyces bracarensis]|uniref:Importin N-terminal domain-containing protein n=1 Tax=Nakaseomyces bracarensis TaxID=273131 RepID=A0ABR4NU83_9SACH
MSQIQLTELNLVEVLQQASNMQSMGTGSQKLAERQLKQWETEPGFHYLLQSIYLDLSNSLHVRWLAVIQFKNGVEKYWRSTRINAIGKDEKNSIRNRLFEVIDEQNNQLCIQNAQATARISRIDFPVEWPNLFETIEQILTKSYKNDIQVYNILMHVNQIVKILGGARIGRCRPAMQSKIPLIFSLVVRTYLESFDEWTHSDISNSDNFSKLQISYLALKVLRRMVGDGYEYPQRDETVCEFMKLSITHFDVLIANHDNFKKFDLYEKFIKCFGKLYFNLVTNSPANFILLPCSTQILISYTSFLLNKAPNVYEENPDVSGDFWEQVAIRGIMIIKRVINFVSKKGAVTLKARSDKANIEASVTKINNEYLNENLIKKLVDVLMDWYLKLRVVELDNWFMDAEEWINEQMAASYEYQIRPCAENFFQDLINTFSEMLVPYLLNKIESSTSSLSDSLEDFLKKDAIYSAFQLSAPAVSDTVDFDRLLVDVFLPEATNMNYPSERLKILRRRVALIINEWSVVKCSEESKGLCYKYFSEVLASEEDKVVLLTVVQSLKTMIDDWNFNKDNFQPYLNTIASLLLRKILPSVSLTETRLYVLNTMSDLIIQTKPLISQDLLIEVLQIVPDLWEIATNNATEAILCNALLRLLRHLASSLGPLSYMTWDISIPILMASCNPSAPEYQLLNEDAFELWGVLLQNYMPDKAQLDSRFLELLPYIYIGVESHTEILPTLLELIKSYALVLEPQQFFSNDSLTEIFKQLSSYLLKLREDSFQLILEIWEILTLRNEANFESLLLENFYRNGILKALLDCITLEESLSSYQLLQVLQIVARICFVNPSAYVEFLSTYHKTLPNSVHNLQLPAAERKLVVSDMAFDEVVRKFISIWIICFKDIYDPKQKKVHILGLSSLIRSGVSSVIEEFPAIASLWIEMLEEIRETNGGDCEKYHLNDIVTEQSYEFFPLTSEQMRHHELIRANDPAHNISLKDFISQTMQFLESHLGPDKYQAFINGVNPTIFENLQLFLSMQENK